MKMERKHIFQTVCIFVSFALPVLLHGQETFPRPNSGDEAPDFKLKLVDGSEDRSLHEATRPTVLFFGSYS